MAVEFPAQGDGLNRTSNNVAASSDYSCTYWWYFSSATPSNYRTGWMAINSTTLYDQYIGIYWNLPAYPNTLTLEIYGDGTLTYYQKVSLPVRREMWVPVGYVRQGNTHQLWVNRQLVGTLTVDMSATSLAETWLGTDTFPSMGGHQISRFREWDRALTPNELLASWATASALPASDLWASLPLSANFNDTSGHGYNFAAVNGAFIDNTFGVTSAPAPGWAWRSNSAVATGTTSLTITAPAGIVDGDLLVMQLGHRSAGYATVPAGWALVGRDIASPARGEMYWKRASSEPGSYSITGLSTAAAGAISCYTGGPAAGDMVLLASVRANASGTNGTPAIDTTGTPNALVIFGMGCDQNRGGSVTFGVLSTTVGTYRFGDPDLTTVRVRVGGGTSTGGGAGCSIGDAIKIVDGSTINPTVCLSLSTANNVGIVAVFVPASGVVPTGTRYYFSSKAPIAPQREPWALAGSWPSAFDDSAPSTASQMNQPFLLATCRGQCGAIYARNYGTNQQGDYDVLIKRFLTPPLLAQTLAGTINFVIGLTVRWLDDTAYTLDTVARLKLHVYITVGQTSAVRQTLVDNYVSSTDLPKLGPIPQWVTLDADQSLAGGVIHDGDSLVVEIGTRVVSSPTPAPTYPPSRWSEFPTVPYGTSSVIATGSGTPYALHAVVGNPAYTGSPFPLGTPNGVPFLQLTDDLVEAAPVAPPVNSTPATAIVVTATPYSETAYDTGTSPSNARAAWYAFTADRTGDLIVAAFGSWYCVQMDVWQGDPSDYSLLTAVTSYGQNGVQGGNRSLAVRFLSVTQGQTYYVRAYSLTIRGYASPSSGGPLRISFQYREPPQQNDIFAVASNVTVWRDGLLINANPDFFDFTPLGVAIDYTQRPLLQIDGGTNTNYRLYVSMFRGGFLNILDLTTLNTGVNEIDFISEPLDLISQGGRTADLSAIHVTRGGTLYQQTFGNGFLLVVGIIEGIPAYLNAFSNTLGKMATRVMDAALGDNQPGNPFAKALEYYPTPQLTAPWHGAIDEFNNILYYSSAGYYFPLGGQEIRRFNLTTQTDMGVFATMPLSGVNPGPKGMCLIPAALGGGLLVANGNVVTRTNAAGAIIQTYAPVSPGGYVLMLTDVHLTQDFTKFWVYDLNGTEFFQFDLASGAQLQAFNTWQSYGNSIQFALFAPDGEPPPPPEPGLPGCVPEFPVDSGGGPACAPTWSPNS
jgi:hypothetical protein